MRFYYRVPIWPIVLTAFCLIGGICVFVGRYPLITAGVVLGALALYVMSASLHGSWNPARWWDSEPTVQLEPQPALASRMKGLNLDILLGPKPFNPRGPNSR